MSISTDQYNGVDTIVETTSDKTFQLKFTINYLNGIATELINPNKVLFVDLIPCINGAENDHNIDIQIDERFAKNFWRAFQQSPYKNQLKRISRSLVWAYNQSIIIK